MSIALDIALYLRDHGRNLKGLSAADRGVLYTLAFRIGTKIYTWISQASLANELCMSTRNIRDYLRNLERFGLIITRKSKKDSRKLEYRISEFVHNYHQNSRVCEKNYRKDCSGIYKDSGTNVPVFSESIGTNVPVINSSTDIQVIDSNEENHQEKSPKVTYINKVTLRDKTKERNARKSSLVVITPPSFLNENIWNEFLEHRKSMKSPMTELAQRKAFKVLEKLKEEGQDVEQVVNNSIVNGWKGLFPIKEKAYGNASVNAKSGNGGKEEFDVMRFLIDETARVRSLNAAKVDVS